MRLLALAHVGLVRDARSDVDVAPDDGRKSTRTGDPQNSPIPYIHLNAVRRLPACPRQVLRAYRPMLAKDRLVQR